MTRSGTGARKRGQLRIIGGRWRGRKLSFSAAEGLRPTPDRVRETLFNWLAPYIHDARCLDLFAGSGALGLEALSRGAASCDFIDTSAAALADIERHLDLLQAGAAGRCHAVAALQYLTGATSPFDIVFIDPPYASDLASLACAQLSAAGLLATDAMIYVETGASDNHFQAPPGWELHRERSAGEVSYRLFTAAQAVT